MWSELKDGLTFSSNGAFCTFFFFFFWISAWLGHFGRYRPIRPIRTESALFGLRRRRFQPHRPWFQPHWPDSGIATWHDAARTRGLRRPSRIAASDAGALAWEPRPCIPDWKSQSENLPRNMWGCPKSNPNGGTYKVPRKIGRAHVWTPVTS